MSLNKKNCYKLLKQSWIFFFHFCLNFENFCVNHFLNFFLILKQIIELFPSYSYSCNLLSSFCNLHYEWSLNSNLYHANMIPLSTSVCISYWFPVCKHSFKKAIKNMTKKYFSMSPNLRAAFHCFYDWSSSIINL